MKCDECQRATDEGREVSGQSKGKAMKKAIVSLIFSSLSFVAVFGTPTFPGNRPMLRETELDEESLVRSEDPEKKF